MAQNSGFWSIAARPNQILGSMLGRCGVRLSVQFDPEGKWTCLQCLPPAFCPTTLVGLLDLRADAGGLYSL